MTSYMEELLGVKFGRNYIPGTIDKEKNIIYVQDDGKGDLFEKLDKSIKIVHTKDGLLIEEACCLSLPDGTLFHALRCTGDINGWFEDIKACAQTLRLVTANIRCNNVLKNASIWLINHMPNSIGNRLINCITDGVKDYNFVLSSGTLFKLSECKIQDSMSNGMTQVRIRGIFCSAKQERKREVLDHLKHLEMAANDMLEGADRAFVLEALQEYCALFTKTHKKEQYFDDIIHKVLKKHKANETDGIKDYIYTATEIMQCTKVCHSRDADLTSVSVIHKTSDRKTTKPKK